MSTVPVYPDTLPISSVQNIAGLLKNGKVKENLPSFMLDVWWVWGFGQKMVVEVTTPNLFGGNGPMYPSAIPTDSVRTILNLVKSGELKKNVPEFLLHGWWIWGYSQKVVFGSPADENMLISHAEFDPVATLEKLAAMDEDAVVSQVDLNWKELLIWLLNQLQSLIKSEVGIQSEFDAVATFDKLAAMHDGEVTAQVSVPWLALMQWAIAELLKLLQSE